MWNCRISNLLEIGTLLQWPLGDVIKDEWKVLDWYELANPSKSFHPKQDKLAEQGIQVDVQSR